MNRILNLMITGVGGQGNVISSTLIGSAAMMSGYEVTNAEVYGASQRGGSVTSHIRISKSGEHGPLIPEGSADVIIGFEPVETLKALEKSGNPDVKIILNPHPSSITNLMGRVMDYPNIEEILKLCDELSSELRVVEATKLAEELGSPIVHNIVMVGCLAGTGWTPLERDAFERAIERIFSDDKVGLNLKAFEKGIEFIEG